MSGETTASPPLPIAEIILRGALFTGVWWAFNLDDPDSWLVGVPTVILAVLLSLAVLPASAWRPRPIATARFVIYFLRNSAFSSVDVALRALRPDMPLDPGIVQYRLRLTQETALSIVANTTSLLPGTLSADVRDGVLIVHSLDINGPVIAELRALEEHVARMYGITLEEG
jgi:multicomponent Na+:H+ antiporter subunit E